MSPTFDSPLDSTYHPWQLHVDDLHAERLVLAETLFSLANGFIGTRGTFEEGISDNPDSCEGTYLNGIYMNDLIHYEEVAHAFATHNNKMLQVPDAKALHIFIDGVPFMPSALSSHSHQRTLDFRTGVLERETVWQLGGDKQVKITSRRLVSLKHQNIILQETTITAINFNAEFVVESLLGIHHLQKHEKDSVDPRAGHISPEESLRYVTHKTDDNYAHFLHEVEGSGFIVGSALLNKFSHAHTAAESNKEHTPDGISTKTSAFLKDGQSIKITKNIAYAAGNRGEDDNIIEKLQQSIEEIRHKDFEEIVQEQVEVLKDYWKYADVCIEGDAALQQGLRFNLFHIFQSAGRDGKRSVAAKGLSGPGYDGHYFWDTEIYIIPFFVYSMPEIAKSLLSYRYSILNASRKRAREMSHKKGALFAWRTIGGDECSAYFPAGTAQYHINAAIAYAILLYHDVTQDWEFMRECGLEILLETARIWADIGHFSAYKDNKFCINEVTGPDEYSAMVDNNFYTNAMAQMHLRGALNILKEAQQDYPEAAKAITEKISLEDSELELWKKAVDNMYLPYDKDLDINPQDDGFLGKPRWDFENTPKENHPLLLHYHPLVIHRHQVLKQADTVLAMALLGHQFDSGTRVNNLEYYMPLTTHDSTLSTCIYSVECARAGKYKEAYNFFEQTARMDLDNLHHNTEYGLHTACMAGSYTNIVMGFAGMEMYDNGIRFKPHCPKKWDKYSFNIRFQKAVIHVQVDKNSATYTLQEGEACLVTHYSHKVALEAAGDSESFQLDN